VKNLPLVAFDQRPKNFGPIGARHSALRKHPIF
jgi:hypothetical protein